MQSQSLIDSYMDFDVIIPTHNRIDLLRRAIQSVLDQELAAHQVIVVDDASTKDLSLVRSWAEKHGCVWERLEVTQGPAAARNIGVSLGASEWVTFLDSDDIWHPKKMMNQADWHTDHPEFRISQVKETWIRGGRELQKPGHWEFSGGDLFAESCERCSIGPSCVAMSRGLWEEVGGFDSRYGVCEDYELWLRITKSLPVGLIPGKAMVEKHAGHGDQLSMLVPAMDRYRVIALLELLIGGHLTEEQRAVVIKKVRQKARILLQGAAKRGLDHRSDIYRRVLALKLEEAGSAINPVVETLWHEVSSG
jgi:glycosyltransferase involved in cell wall biosynthesis